MFGRGEHHVLVSVRGLLTLMLCKQTLVEQLFQKHLEEGCRLFFPHSCVTSQLCILFKETRVSFLSKQRCALIGYQTMAIKKS